MNMLLQVSDLANKGNYYLTKIADMGISYLPKILGAIVFYIVGSWIIGRLANVTRKVMSKRNYDPSLLSFLISFIKIGLSILLIIAIFGILGVDTTAFAALIVGAGLAIGSALNGTLGNFAGGVMMLIFKPFKVGDIIDAQSVLGTVIEQGIFATTVLTPENKTVIIPNGPLSTGIITNLNTHGNLRVDLSMAIAIDADIDLARSSAIAAMKTIPSVLETPAADVTVNKVGDGMITLAVRPYTTQTDYWTVYFGVQEAVKKAWDVAGVKPPIPHRVIINK